MVFWSNKISSFSLIIIDEFYFLYIYKTQNFFPSSKMEIYYWNKYKIEEQPLFREPINTDRQNYWNYIDNYMIRTTRAWINLCMNHWGILPQLTDKLTYRLTMYIHSPFLDNSAEHIRTRIHTMHVTQYRLCTYVCVPVRAMYV